MVYSCLCTSFVSCYCVLTEKIDENDNVVTIDHFSRLRVGSLLVSFGDSNVWPSGLLQATVSIYQLQINGPVRGNGASTNWTCARTRASINTRRVLKMLLHLQADLSSVNRSAVWNRCENESTMFTCLRVYPDRKMTKKSTYLFRLNSPKCSLSDLR